MKRLFRRQNILCYFLGMILLSGCSSLGFGHSSDFSYQSLPIAKGSIHSGRGSTVLFKGSPLSLTGNGISQGEALRSAHVSRSDLSVTTLTESTGTVRIISVVPSLDTKVCEQQTHYLSEKNNGLDAQVELYTISVDTPFAQARFAREADIQNVTFLSDYREAAFGKMHGLLLEGPHLLSRAILVVDRQNIVRYIQVNPDLATLPDMEAAFSVARSLVTQ